jgi:hypothetical protein
MGAVFRGLLFAAATTAMAGTAWGQAAPPSGDETDALAGLRAAKVAVAARAAPQWGLDLGDARGSSGMLERQWAATRRWAIAWLTRHSGASGDQLIAAAKRDAGVDLTVLPLEGGGLLLTAQTDDVFGTAFILRRGESGRYLTAFALDEPGTFGGGGPPKLGSWRSDRASWGCHDHRPQKDWLACGPMVPAEARLLDGATGERRFAIIGCYVKPAGATNAYQLSIWRWTGRAARPLIVYSFAQMADDPLITKVDSRTLTLREKGSFKRLIDCGACSGQQKETQFDLSGKGVRLVASRSLTPQLDLVDELYDRLIEGKTVDDIAASGVAQVLAKQVQALKADAGKTKSGAYLGLLTSWKLTAKGGVETLCLSADDLDHSQLFTLSSHDGRLRIDSVRDTPSACEGPGSQS